MTRVKFGSGLLATLAVALVACVGTAHAETLVLKDFTLIDGTGRPPAAHSALVMTDGRIVWVGPVAELKIPAGARIVDDSGKFVMPGLIDNHVHLSLMHGQDEQFKYYTKAGVEDDLKTYAAYGVTAVQVLGTDGDLIFPLRDAQRAGRPVMARVFTSGQGLTYRSPQGVNGYGGIAGNMNWVTTPADAVKAVDGQAAKHVDLIKLWMDNEQGTIPVKMPYAVSAAAIAEAHKDHLKAVAHVYYLADAKALVAQGVDGFSHSVRDGKVDDALIAAMKAHGTWQMAATLSRELSYTYQAFPFANDPFFTRGEPAFLVATLRSSANIGKRKANPLNKFYGPNFANAMANFAAEAKAGIPYGMGTDSGPPGRFVGYFAHLEMELMVKAGITPMQAIVAATSSNARFMGARDIGTVAVGKWGDLLVLDKNPVADIRNTRTIHAVYLAGKEVHNVNQ